MRFADTNVLLYSISRDAEDAGKQGRASELLESQDLALSTQVLQEFYFQATHPHWPRPLTHRQAADLVRSYLRFPVQPITPALVLAAMETSHASQISYWDAAILEAARAMGCEIVLTEDLNDGQDYGGVRVENPFVDLS